jgi:hypothetical protein
MGFRFLRRKEKSTPLTEEQSISAYIGRNFKPEASVEKVIYNPDGTVNVLVDLGETGESFGARYGLFLDLDTSEDPEPGQFNTRFSNLIPLPIYSASRKAEVGSY